MRQSERGHDEMLAVMQGALECVGYRIERLGANWSWVWDGGSPVFHTDHRGAILSAWECAADYVRDTLFENDSDVQWFERWSGMAVRQQAQLVAICFDAQYSAGTLAVSLCQAMQETELLRRKLNSACDALGRGDAKLALLALKSTSTAQAEASAWRRAPR